MPFLRFLYNIFMFLALPLVFLRLWLKGRKSLDYRKRWGERLGVVPFIVKPSGIWIHCVSLGEINAALPYIKELLKKYEDHEITVTTTTPTGSAKVSAALQNKVKHMYLPYDVTFLLNNFFKKVKPKLCVIFETELWPNILHLCNNKNIPVLLLNARISKNAFSRYALIKKFTSYMLNKIKFIAVQSEDDYARFTQLGANKNNMKLVGNIKYDVTEISKEELIVSNDLKKQVEDRKVLVAASTHAGEEKLFLKIYPQLCEKKSDLLLILIPRHPQRFEEVAKLLQESNLKFIKRSTKEAISSDIQVVLGDTMGEVKIFYSISNIAFVGGTFVPIGGHNVLEASVNSIPVITGPFIDNCREICNNLVTANAMNVAKDEKQLVNTISKWLCDDDTAENTGNNGYKIIQNSRGVLQKFLEITNNFLNITTTQVTTKNLTGEKYG